MLRRWTRKDGTAVTFTQHTNCASVVRLYRPDKSVLTQHEYPSWQLFQARETAQELADLLGCVEEQAA